MAKITVDGIEMDVPDSVPTETLLQRCGVGDGQLVRRTANGQVQLLPRGREVQLRDGDRLGTISRFRTGRGYRLEGIKSQLLDGASKDTLLDMDGKGTTDQYLLVAADADTRRTPRTEQWPTLWYDRTLPNGKAMLWTAFPRGQEVI